MKSSFAFVRRSLLLGAVVGLSGLAPLIGSSVGLLGEVGGKRLLCCHSTRACMTRVRDRLEF